MGAETAFPASYGMGAGIEKGGERGGRGSTRRAVGSKSEDPGAGSDVKFVNGYQVDDNAACPQSRSEFSTTTIDNISE